MSIHIYFHYSLHGIVDLKENNDAMDKIINKKMPHVYLLV